MSLWTPGGEHPVDRGQPNEPPAEQPADAGGDMPDIMSMLSEEDRAQFERMSPQEQEQARQMVAQMAETRRRMLETPAGVIVANHGMGLYELAAIHLQAQPPQIDEAKVAIDALAGLLEGAGDRLGPDGTTVKEALAQLQLAFVQIKAAVDAEGGDGSDGGPSAPEA